MLASSPIELEVTGLGSAGEGVGRLADGRVVFVPQALPGDRVLVRVGAPRKRVCHAELVSMVTRSVDRVVGECQVTACDNCSLRDFSLAAQHAHKRQRVVEAMRRIGHLEIDAMVQPIRSTDDGWRSRHRARLHATYRGGRWHLGYFSRGSRELIPLSTCAIVWPELEDVLRRLQDQISTLPSTAALFEIEVAYSRCDQAAVANLTLLDSCTDYVGWPSVLQASGLTGWRVSSPGKTQVFGIQQLRYDHAQLSDFSLLYEPGVFTQVNPATNDQLVAALVAAARVREGEPVLELHAGIGNLSIPLARDGAYLCAIESNHRAAALCRGNSRDAGVSVEIHESSDTDCLPRVSSFRTVILDPPRTGAMAVAEAIAESRSVERVFYVSCDPATLARDAKVLVTAGFCITGAQVFDMFPHTNHVETLLCLQR